MKNILLGILDRLSPQFCLELNPQQQQAMVTFTSQTHQEMSKLIESGQTVLQLSSSQRVYFSERLMLIALVRERFKSFSRIQLSAYHFSLLAAMITNYILCKPNPDTYYLLGQILDEMIRVGPQKGRWSVEKAINAMKDQVLSTVTQITSKKTNQ